MLACAGVSLNVYKNKNPLTHSACISKFAHARGVGPKTTAGSFERPRRIFRNRQLIRCPSCPQHTPAPRPQCHPCPPDFVLMSFFSPVQHQESVEDAYEDAEGIHKRIMEECAPSIGRIKIPWSAIAESQQRLEMRPSRLPLIVDSRVMGGRAGKAYGGTSLAPTKTSCPAFQDAYAGFSSLLRPMYVDVSRADMCHAAVCASIKETEEAAQCGTNQPSHECGPAVPRRCAAWLLCSIDNEVDSFGVSGNSITNSITNSMVDMATRRAAVLGDAIAHVATRSDPPATREVAMYVCAPSAASTEIILSQWQPTHLKLSGDRSWGRAAWRQAQSQGLALLIVGWHEMGTSMRMARFELLHTGSGIGSIKASVNTLSCTFAKFIHEGVPLSSLLVADVTSASPVEDEWGRCTERVDTLFVNKLRSPDSVTLSEAAKQDTEPLEFTCIYMRLSPRAQPVDSVTAFPGLLVCKRDHIYAVAEMVAESIRNHDGQLRKPRGVAEEMHGMHCSALHYGPVPLGNEVTFFAPRCLMSINTPPGESIFPHDPNTTLFVRAAAMRPVDDQLVDQFHIMPCDGASLYAEHAQLEIHSKEALQTLVTFTNGAIEEANRCRHNESPLFGRRSVPRAPRAMTDSKNNSKTDSNADSNTDLGTDSNVSPALTPNANAAHLYMAVRGMCSFRHLTLGNCYNDVCTHDPMNTTLQRFLLTAMVHLGAHATVGTAMQTATQALAAQNKALSSMASPKPSDSRTSLECARLKAIADAALVIASGRYASSRDKRRRIAHGCVADGSIKAIGDTAQAAKPLKTQRLRDAIADIAPRRLLGATVRIAPPYEDVATFVVDSLHAQYAQAVEEQSEEDETRNSMIEHGGSAFENVRKATIEERRNQLAVCLCRVCKVDCKHTIFLVEVSSDGALVQSIWRLTPQSAWKPCAEGDLLSCYLRFDATNPGGQNAQPHSFAITTRGDRVMLEDL